MKQNVKRLWLPIGTVLLLAAWVGWGYASEHTMRVPFLMMSLVLALLVLGFWWCFLSGAFRWRSLLGGMVALAVLITGGIMTLRWEGSVDGATPFRLVWKWTPPAEEGLVKLETVTAEVPDELVVPPGLADCPRFLGEAGNGVVPDPGLAPDWESNPPEELWRVRVGVGWSAFAVSGRWAVTQEQREEAELVTCYDVLTGELLWAHREETRFEEAMGGPGPRATPTIRDGMVYAMGATGLLHALDLETGKARWRTDLRATQDLRLQEWGFAASPLVVDDLVIVTGGRAKEAADGSPVVFAYERDSGSLRWRYGPGPAAYSSPRLLEINGDPQVVVILGEAVVGLSPGAGEEQWRFPWPGTFPKVSQPIQVAPDQLLVTSSYGMQSHLLRIEGARVEAVWTGHQMKTKFSSPVVKDGYAYGLDEGKLICMEVATGDRVWKGARYGYGQNLLVGPFLMIQAERGDVVLTRPEPERHVELARISPLTHKTWNAPCLAGRFLLVRNDREAVCLRLPR